MAAGRKPSKPCQVTYLPTTLLGPPYQPDQSYLLTIFLGLGATSPPPSYYSEHLPTSRIRATSLPPSQDYAELYRVPTSCIQLENVSLPARSELWLYHPPRTLGYRPTLPRS
eukprot:1052877-Rhodomonas_salina.2